MSRLKPHRKYKCIAPYHWFTIGKVYQANGDGFLIDDDGDTRNTLSIDDEFFRERFRLVKTKGL